MEPKEDYTIKQIETQEDLLLAFEIRRKVFIEEQNVLEAEEYDEFETISKHFLCSYKEKALGTARYRKTEKGFKLERFCVLKEFRKTGVGAILVNKLLEEVKKENGKFIYLHAQVSAKDFYSRFGFKEFGDTFIEAEIEHVKMIYQGS